MANVEKGFMTLTKVEQDNPANIYCELNLPPFVDKDRIAVNIERIERLKMLAGIEAIVMVGTTGNDTSTSIPNIAGRNSDGSAFATKSATKTTMPTFQNVSKDLGSRRVRSRKIVVGVNYNLDEVSQRLNQSAQEARSVKPWTSELDKGLRTSIRNEGTQNLIKKDGSPLFWIYYISPIVLANMALSGVANIIGQNPLAASFDFGYMTFLAGIYNLGRVFDPNERLSMFQGPQWDRAAVLKTLTHTQSLVTEIKPDKK